MRKQLLHLRLEKDVFLDTPRQLRLTWREEFPMVARSAKACVLRVVGPGNVLRPEVNIPSPAIRIPPDTITSNDEDLGNCSRYTESGVSDASVSAGRAEPIDELYS